MDKSEFGIGKNQSIKVLVFIGSQSKIKRIIKKQEWVT